MKQGIKVKSKIELLVKAPNKEVYDSLHVTNTEMFMPPRIGEYIIFQGDNYIVCDIVHNYDKNTIEVHLVDTGVY